MTTLLQTIQNGPNRFSRVLGHAELNGLSVRVRVRCTGIYHAQVEWTDATRENDCWHMLGDNYSLAMPFAAFLRSIPSLATLRLTPALSA